MALIGDHSWRPLCHAPRPQHPQNWTSQWPWRGQKGDTHEAHFCFEPKSLLLHCNKVAKEKSQTNPPNRNTEWKDQRGFLRDGSRSGCLQLGLLGKTWSAFYFFMFPRFPRMAFFLLIRRYVIFRWTWFISLHFLNFANGSMWWGSFCQASIVHIILSTLEPCRPYGHQPPCGWKFMANFWLPQNFTTNSLVLNGSLNNNINGRLTRSWYVLCIAYYILKIR